MTPTAQYIPSHLSIIQRVAKTDENPNGVQHMSYIPLKRPAVILLGGGATTKARYANYYASMIETILENADIHDVDIYSVYYKFGTRIPGLDRANVFRRAGYKVRLSSYPPDNDRLEERLDKMRTHEPIPNTAIRTFNIFIRPRLIKADGQRRDLNQIISYMRRIFFWTHSHGGAVMNYLGDYMHDKMQQMGFSKSEIDTICKNILIIGHAPTTPMFHQPFTAINFASRSDTIMENVNHMTNYLSNNTGDVTPMYFPEPQGNLVTTGQFNPDFQGEHKAAPLLPHSAEERALCPDGRVVFDAERNAIVAAARSITRTGGGIPPIRELLSGPTVDFDKLADAGKSFYDQMLYELRANKKKRD